MRRRIVLLAGGLLIAALFILTQVFHVVREGELVVVTSLGRVERAITRAGLHARRPWPLQRLHRLDGRAQCLEGALQETLTHDGKNVLVSVYAGWRIADPILFLERLGGMEQAEINLDGLLRNHKNAAIGRHPFSALVNPDPAALRIEQVEDEILRAVRPEALERYGIEVAFVGVRRLALPESITAKVFERMRAEREELAERYRSEGEAEAVKIRAEADAQRAQIVAQAEADAVRLRAEGDAQAAAHFRVFEKHPDLALFLRKLDVLEQTLKGRATVVLGVDTEPFDLLRTAPAVHPAPAP